MSALHKFSELGVNKRLTISWAEKFAVRQELILPEEERSERPTGSGESDQTANAPSLKKKRSPKMVTDGKEKRRSLRLMEKALVNAHQYDELRNGKDMKRQQQQSSKSDGHKKAKYENQVQKELLKKELGKRDDSLAAVGVDATKQKDLGDGPENKLPAVSFSDDSNEIGSTPIESGKPQQQCAYRELHSLDEEAKEPQSAVADCNLDVSGVSQGEEKPVEDIRQQSSSAEKKEAEESKENVGEDVSEMPIGMDKHDDGTKEEGGAAVAIETIIEQPKFDISVGPELKESGEDDLERKEERNA